MFLGCFQFIYMECIAYFFLYEGFQDLCDGYSVWIIWYMETFFYWNMVSQLSGLKYILLSKCVQIQEDE